MAKFDINGLLDFFTVEQVGAAHNILTHIHQRNLDLGETLAAMHVWKNAAHKKIGEQLLARGQELGHDYPERKKGNSKYREPMQPKVVIGFCPSCNSQLVGTPLKGCETKKTGRYFYKECSSCSYYAEIFKSGNK